MFNLLMRAMLITAAIGLTACERAEIIAPLNDSVEQTKPADFQILFTDGIPSDLAIELNTKNVTERFELSQAGAISIGGMLDDYIYPGRNILRVKAYNKMRQIAFYYDATGPVVHILNVNRQNNTITGYVADPGGVRGLTLDGVAVPLDENMAFTTSFQDKPFNTFTATDDFDHESSMTFARGDNTWSGLSARLNQGGLDFLVAALQEELKDADFGDIARQIEPVSLLDISPLGINLFSLTMSLTDISAQNLQVDLQAQPNQMLDTRLGFDNFRLGLYVQGNILLLPWRSEVVAAMSSVDAQTSVLADIRNADLDFSIANTEIAHSPIDLQFGTRPDLFDAVTSAMLNGLVGMFEPMIISAVEKFVVPMLSDFVKDIPIELTVATVENESISVKALPQFMDTQDSGITIDLDTRIWAPQPAAGVPQSLGSLYREGDTPTLGTTTPDGIPFDFGVSILDNVVNQALMAVHDAGITTMAISPGFYTNLTPEGISVYATEEQEIDSNDQIGLRIEPYSAPTLSFMSGRDDGAAGVLTWHDVRLTFDLYKPVWNEYRTLFGITFDMTIPFEIDATEDGFLAIGLEQLPNIQVTDVDDTGMVILSTGFMNSTVEYVMPTILPDLAQRLKAVPLPRIYNHTVHMNDFWVAGSNNSTLALAGDLIPLAVTAAASAPSTEIVNVAKEQVTNTVEDVNAQGTIVSRDIKVENGAVTIDLAGLNPVAHLGVLEYRYRVDGGAWSIWKPRREIHLSRLLAGDHSVEICSRTVLLKQETGCPVVEFTTTVNDSM